MKTAIIFATLALALGCVCALPESRIVGGEDAASDTAPFIVSLQWSTETRRRHFCAAAIINSEWILTAAHCMQALPTDSLIKIVAGRTNLNAAESEDEQIRFVDDIVVHQNFTGGISADDIALLKINEAFEWTDSVQPIALPRAKDELKGKVSIYGWGSTTRDYVPEYPEALQVAVADIIAYKDCEAVLGGEGATPLKKSNLCTGPLEGGVSTCNGDSGGPLVKSDKEGQKTLVGIVSWGFYPCGGAGSPSIYAKVASYIQWINEHTQ